MWILVSPEWNLAIAFLAFLSFRSLSKLPPRAWHGIAQLALICTLVFSGLLAYAGTLSTMTTSPHTKSGINTNISIATASYVWPQSILLIVLLPVAMTFIAAAEVYSGSSSKDNE